MLSEKTIEAMIEAKRISDDSSVKGYRDVEELLADLRQDDEFEAMENV